MEAEENDMIGVGDAAPDFTLEDQFGRKVALGDFKGRRHVLLLFYPLDWTPT
ncbi:MAG: redoxin domain-containing protein [Deltaproteobacteria bacterium]|nr:redoxin domain-containing protein [Deltaproteobacteria bacterium]MBW2417503.1 redoxin domain-containing protein [Deltaproteobacteria bacterium]